MNEAKRTPVVSLLLIAANIAAAFLLVWQPNLIDSFGFYSGRPTVVSALASLFLHANLFHLLGNMVFLAAAGPAAEAAVGSIRLFGVYLAAGLSGVLAHWILSQSPDVALIGASGAVAGCVALSSVRFYAVRVPLAPGVSVSVLAVAGAWLALQVVGGFVVLGETAGSVAYWAHVGGAVAGLLLALAFRAPREAARIESAKVVEQMSGRSPAASLAAAEDHLQLHPRDVPAWVEMGDALSKLGERGRAAEAYLQAIEFAPAARQPAIFEKAAQNQCLAEWPSSKRTHWAAKLHESQSDIAAALLESVVSGPADDSQRPEAILALAEMRRASDPARAEGLIGELFESYPLHPAADVARARGWLP